MRAGRDLARLVVVAIVFAVCFALLVDAIGPRSPWLGLLLMFFFMGLAKIAELGVPSDADALNEYVLLMHDDAPHEGRDAADEGWDAYIGRLAASGRFDGGSSIGPGACVRNGDAPPPSVSPLSGYLRVRAAGIDDAKRFLAGNPAFEAGATVEIRELTRD